MNEINTDFTNDFSHFYNPLLSWLYGKLHNFHDAEDICNELFFTYYQKYSSINNKKAWLYGAANLLLQNHFKKNIQINKHVPYAIDYDLLADDMMEQAELRILVNDILEDEQPVVQNIYILRSSYKMTK